ncbi:MAG: Rrf2 family transcriptional regulator [Lachnospiraceae bacterium]|nr:Rrf2 family transcriptional regulator [Lachnospiraceae bacterium]
MRVSTRVEYGLIALTDIVVNGENGMSVSAPDIAQRENISHKYLEHILLLLRQAGFIKAQKGLRGGYALACSPDKITLYDVVNALDKSILADIDPMSGSDLGNAVNECFWGKINGSLSSFAKEIKLGEFASQCRDASGKWDMYVI